MPLRHRDPARNYRPPSRLASHVRPTPTPDSTSTLKALCSYRLSHPPAHISSSHPTPLFSNTASPVPTIDTVPLPHASRLPLRLSRRVQPTPQNPLPASGEKRGAPISERRRANHALALHGLPGALVHLAGKRKVAWLDEWADLTPADRRDVGRAGKCRT